MKNMNVSLKMVICFAIMILMAATSCIIGVVGMGRLNEANNAMHDEIVVGMQYIAQIRENFQEQRVLVQEVAIENGNAAKRQQLLNKIRNNETEMDGYLQGYQRDILGIANPYNEQLHDETIKASYESFSKLYYEFFQPEIEKLIAAEEAVSMEGIEIFISSYKASDMVTAMDEGYTFFEQIAVENVRATDDLFSYYRTFLWIAAIITFGVSAFFAVYLPVTIARPLRHMVKVANAVSEGNMGLAIGYEDRGDEVGKLARAFARMKEEINKQVEMMQAIAGADLTVKPTLRSDHDTMGKAMIDLTDSLDRIITDVSVASEHVSAESRNVAGQSQELAQGTTEQASSVEELSSAFFEISLNTKESANLAGKAADVTEDVRKMAVDGTKQMEAMIQAVKDADDASKSIEKIIKAIEEISFQTNILALNAAVEAAHAGQNGSGFAVVASEVRALASKSAESAKETGELIAGALEKVQLGAEIAAKTSSSFKRIVEGIEESTKLVNDIAKSSEEQAIAIDQINTGISQVAQVIHINSGAAEKCAAAAEQMTKQANMLETAVGRFKVNTEQMGGNFAPPAEVVAAPKMPVAPLPQFAVSPPPAKIDLSPPIPDDFGKY